LVKDHWLMELIQQILDWVQPATWLLGAIAAVLAALWGGMALVKKQAGWPLFVVSFLGLVLWQISAVGLFWDGEWRWGMLVTGVIVFLLAAGCVTFLINRHAWLTVVAFALLALGAQIAPGKPGATWAAVILSVILLGSVLMVFLSGLWSAVLGYTVFALLLVGLGGVSSPATSYGVEILSTNVLSIRASDPEWLIALVLIPLTIALSYRSLAGLGDARRAMALVLRCLLILFLTLALAGVYMLHTNPTVTVLFLLDCSLSMPEEYAPEDKERTSNLAQKRHLDFINDAVSKRDSKHQRDRSGFIPFGRYPRLELPPEIVPYFNHRKVTSSINPNYTDIAHALRVAMACFPESGGQRIVLISDGRENLGNAEEQAWIAKQNGVEIDTVLVTSGNRSENEVLMDYIYAPPLAQGESKQILHVQMHNRFRKNVIVRFSLTKSSLRIVPDPNDPGGPGRVEYRNEPIREEIPLRLTPGGYQKDFYVQQPETKEEESVVYKAKIIPIGVEKEPIDIDNEQEYSRLDKEAVKLDRPENNYASTMVLARGEKKVLVIEPKIGDHKLLVETLQKSSNKLKVATITPAALPQENTDLLNFYFSGFDCIILANVPRESFTQEQDAALRVCVHEQGCGLIMIGGRDSFGAGAWQDTEVEKALPVTCDLRSLKVEGRSGLVLIMHASEIAEGNMWQKQIATIAVKKLSPLDMFGMLYYDFTNGGTKWHIDFQQIGDKQNRDKILGLVDTMSPGDMPDAEPSLRMAYDTLTDPKHQLGTKHMVFISDGDHWKPPLPLLKKIRDAKITVTTVCITSHGQTEYKNMGIIAEETGGRQYPKPDAQGKYKPLNPQQLPAIYMKETRLVSQSFFHEKAFTPELLLKAGPTEGLPDPLPDLYGFVRTSPRPGPLVQLPIMTPKLGKEDPWPILAHWQYGLGKGVAFTSDALSIPPNKASWDRDWAKSPMYARFWDQLVTWSLRELDKGDKLRMTAKVKDGKVLLEVTAVQKEIDKTTGQEILKPKTDLNVVVRVTSPNPQAGDATRPDIKLEQKNVGVYVGETTLEDVGSYLLTAFAYQPKREKGKDGEVQIVRDPFAVTRTAVTISYPRELAEMDNNVALLQRISEITGGQTYRDDPESLSSVAARADLYRTPHQQPKSLQSIWHWLLVLTGLGLLLDVAVRRIAIDPVQATALVGGYWERLRGRRTMEATPQMLDRLKTRKERVGEALEREKAGRRFEGTDLPVALPPAADTAAPPASKPPPMARPAPKVAPEQGAETTDYASRLLRAKRRAMEERDKDNPPDRK
jgi:uncharacterized membrane protein/Mg-chelatase subunit ChlD